MSTNIQYNMIQLRDFGNENLDYITAEFVMRCAQAGAQGIGMMIEHVFFHPDHHENRTVSIRGTPHCCSARIHKQNEWLKRSMALAYNDMVHKARGGILTPLKTHHPSFTCNPDNAHIMFEIAAIPPKDNKLIKGRTIARLFDQRGAELL